MKHSEERLGAAWVHFNKWEWDDIFDPKPDNYDKLPHFLKEGECQHTYLRPQMEKVERAFADMMASKYWWIIELGRTEKEWKDWYFSPERTEIDFW